MIALSLYQESLVSQPVCANQSSKFDACPCSYQGCPRHAKCCECIQSHVSRQQLPACCFPSDAERTYDRSFAKFVETYKHLAK